MLIETSADAKTQKAKGFLAMRESGELDTPAFWAYSLPLTDEDKGRIAERGIGTPFIRPCPTTPRHGFVDSRAINSFYELAQVEEETLAEDKNAELIVMEEISCAASMIITPYNVAIGPGHDGATQGNDSMLFPLAHVSLEGASLDPKSDNAAPLLATAGIDQTAYFEVLRNYATLSGKPQFVQLRNGPKPPAPFEGNWVPQDTVVTGFISDNLSELDFEREIKTVKPGTVCLHEGGTAISHYFVHASENKVPVIMEGEVSIGDTLKKNVVELPVRVDRFAMGLEQGATIALDSSERYSALGCFALTMIHNASVLKSDYHGAHLLGCAVSILMRLAFTAILGEYRHVRKGSRDRHYIYMESLRDFDSYWNGRAEVTRAERSFLTSRRWGKMGAYGGKKWADCTTSAKALERAIVTFIRSRDAGDLSNVIVAAHSTVNCAHNNGPFLSKFIKSSCFDAASRGDLSLTAQSAFTAHWLSQLPHIPVYGSIHKKWSSARVTGNTVMMDQMPKRPAVPRANMTLQFYWRGDDAHFQFGSYGKYVSASITIAEYPDAFFKVNAYLKTITDSHPSNSSSFADSPREYWLLVTNKDGLSMEAIEGLLESAAGKTYAQDIWDVCSVPIELKNILKANGIDLAEMMTKELINV